MIVAHLSPMIASLRAVSAGLHALARGEAVAPIAEAMAARGAALLDEGFASATAPDGSAWEPAARDYGHPLLDASGSMRASARCEVVSAEPTRITLLFSIADEKAVWHQFGTVRGGPTTSALRAQNRKSGRVTMSGTVSAFHEGAERQHIPARKMIFDEGETPAPWVAALEVTGQHALDQWMTARIKF